MAGAACRGAAAVRGRVARGAEGNVRRLRAEAAALLLAVFACGRGCACVGPLCAATLSGIVLFPGGTPGERLVSEAAVVCSGGTNGRRRGGIMMHSLIGHKQCLSVARKQQEFHRTCQ